MWIYILPFFVAGLMFFFTGNYEVKKADKEEARAVNQMERYRAFMITADQYFKANPAPSVVTAYTWAQIRDAAAPSQANFSMQPDWKVVRGPTGQWAACTQLDPLTVAKLNELYSDVKTEAPMPSRLISPSALTTGGGGSLGLNSVNSGVGLIGVGNNADSLNAANLCDAA